MSVKLHVCVTCRAGQAVEEGEKRPGALLYEALLAESQPDGVTITEVSCLSACKSGCAVALSAPGKWSYVYGQMTTEDAADILAGSAAYAATSDGIVPWRERPEQFRKRSVARIPPFIAPVEAAE